MPRKTDSLVEPAGLEQKFQDLYNTIKEVCNDLSLDIKEAGVKTNSKGDQISYLLSVESYGDMFTIIMTVSSYNTSRITFHINVAEQLTSLMSCITIPGYQGIRKSIKQNPVLIKNELKFSIETILNEFCTECFGVLPRKMVETFLTMKDDVPYLLGKLFLNHDIINATQIQELKYWYDKYMSLTTDDQKSISMFDLYEKITSCLRHTRANGYFSVYTALSGIILDFMNTADQASVVLSEANIQYGVVENYKEVVNTLLPEKIEQEALQNITEPHKKEVVPQVSEVSYSEKLLQTVTFK